MISLAARPRHVRGSSRNLNLHRSSSVFWRKARRVALQASLPQFVKGLSETGLDFTSKMRFAGNFAKGDPAGAEGQRCG